MRFLNSVRNLIASWIGRLLIVFITFVTRYFFIKILGSEYLGISGLFSNILDILSLAEMGVGTAVSFSLYQPIKEHDEDTIRSIMALFNRFYMIAGSMIIVLGLAITPFLKYLINEMPDNIPNIHLYFILYVLNIAASYVLSYKEVLIIADQKKYLSEMNYCFWFSALNIIQIIALLVTQNYFVYLIIQICFTLLQNISLSIIVNKRYPYLKQKNAPKLKDSTFKSIKKNTLATMFQKVGTIVVNATDNIVISKFVGLMAVGLYSNYLSIINAVNMLGAQMFSAITASVGDFNLSATNKQVEGVFRKAMFINFWTYGFVSVCLYNLLTPFINVWLGLGYGMSDKIVSVLVMNFYLMGMRQSVMNFRNAIGIYWQDKVKPLCEAMINLVVSVILVQQIGMIGVFLGTTISILAVTSWWEPHTLYKYGFCCTMKEYYKRYLSYAVITVVAAFVTAAMNQRIVIAGVAGFGVKILVCLIVTNGIFLLVFMKTQEFKGLISYIKVLKNHRKDKI